MVSFGSIKENSKHTKKKEKQSMKLRRKTMQERKKNINILLLVEQRGVIHYTCVMNLCFCSAF